MAIAGIARVGHQHFVTWAGQQTQCQQQGTRCAGGDDDACWVDRGVPALVVKTRNRGAQFGQA